MKESFGSNLKAQEGPGFFSGLLVLASGVLVFAGLNTPAHLLLDDAIVMLNAKDTVQSLHSRDTSSKTSVFASFSYDDYYHAKSTDDAKNPSLRTDVLAESPRFYGGAVIKRPHWALSPSWAVCKGFSRSSNADDVYFYRGALNSNKVTISGWFSSNAMIFAGSIGWNLMPVRDRASQGEGQFPNNQIASNLSREKCDYSLSIGCDFKDMFVSAYLEKTLLPVIIVSITNTVNSAVDEFNCVGQVHTAGFRATIKRRPFFGEIEAGFSDIASDTASSAASSRPMTFNSRVTHGKVKTELPMLKLRPCLSLSGAIAGPGMRGFDGSGGPLFFNLDHSELYGVAGSFRLMPPGKFEAGITGELFSFRNLASGRFDPFFLSTISLFMWDKYKIDSLAFSYRSYGIFTGRKIKPLPWWQCDGFLSVSRLRISSLSNTREFDFSDIIPRLVNPQKNVFLDEDYALCIIRLANEINIGKMAISAAVQQAVPINLKPRATSRIHGAEPGANVKKSSRGGTRYCVGAGYGW